MTMTRMMAAGLVASMAAGVALAGVDRASEAELTARLQGKTVVTKIDIKNIKIKKQVRGDRAMGGFGAENMEQTKDATVVAPGGVSYREEAHSREVIYAQAGTSVTIEDIDLGRNELEIEVTSPNRRESTTVTFELDGDGASLDRMLAETFEVR